MSYCFSVLSLTTSSEAVRGNFLDKPVLSDLMQVDRSEILDTQSGALEKEDDNEVSTMLIVLSL